jgi:hypothetical protein
MSTQPAGIAAYDRQILSASPPVDPELVVTPEDMARLDALLVSSMGYANGKSTIASAKQNGHHLQVGEGKSKGSWFSRCWKCLYCCRSQQGPLDDKLLH